MKKIFIKDLLTKKFQKNIELFGWVKNKRIHSNTIFWDVVDSTGEIQVLLTKENLGNKFNKIKNIPLESAIKIIGCHQYHKNINKNKIEIIAREVEMIGKYRLNVTPRPRSDFPIFDQKYTNHILKNRSLYLRNPRQSAVLNFKSKFILEMHKYFQKNKFTFIEPPILTEMLLYDDKTAFSFNYEGNKVWLSQCCTFQLEAAIMAFEKVYSITPSFRSEHSRSDRHLNEYTHLKVEVAWIEKEQLIQLTEKILYNMAKIMKVAGEEELKKLGINIDLKDYKPPFKRITYNEAIKILKQDGHSLYGKSIGNKQLMQLTKKFGNKHIWIEYIPRSAEGFPFAINPDNKELTIAADLIAPYGFGEIGGIAEKICSKNELLERMAEKGRIDSKNLERYKSYIELRDAGLPPHGGIGMGIDRIVRYLLKLPHVKDVLPYPRLFGRRWNP